MTNLTGFRLTILGATGAQGGATARAALTQGATVRALVRDPDSPAARALAELGVELVPGDLEDGKSLIKAFSGADGVFFALPNAYVFAGQSQGQTIVTAAERAAVPHLIHTTVSNTGWRARYPDVVFAPTYWDVKEAMEQRIRDADIGGWTILKPAYFMDNFLPETAALMYPDLHLGRIAVATHLDVALPLIATEDIGTAAAAAFADPARFAHAEIELGGDARTYPQIAATLSAELPYTVHAVHVSEADMVAAGIPQGVIDAQLWINDVNYIAAPEDSAPYGLHPMTFAQWARRHHDDLRSRPPTE